MKRAVITGATGAIGTALTAHLVRQGVEVLVLCRPGSGRNNRILKDPLVSVLPCPLDEMASLENRTGKKYDIFYHLAWAGTAGAARNDMKGQAKNIQYALDGVELAGRFGCRRFVGAGSQAEYGRVEGLLKPETPVFPENGYGMAKLCAGHMTREHAHQLGMEHIWVRVLSIYGPNDGEQSMVMSTIRRLKAGEVPPFTEGRQMWDYLYSGDVAEAFALLGDKGLDGKTYVLGSGQARPLQEYIEIIRDIAAPGAELGFGRIPYGEKQVMHLCADVGEIAADTGWKARTPFEDGIRAILEADTL